MGITASDFLASAKNMFTAGSETDFRNAVSRSYYAAYHVAAEVAVKHCPDEDAHLHMGSHERLINQYMKCSKLSRGKNLAYILQSLKLERHRADYNLDYDVTQGVTQTHLITVEKFIAELQAIADQADQAALG